MCPKASLYLLTFTLFLTIVTANNITQAFEKHPNFTIMKDLFIKAGLISLINKYQTITVLAVTNDVIGSISNRPDIELKNILMTHVILDYYDELKIQGLNEKSILLTTLYQTTGLGEEMNGFLNCTKSKGKVYFGSGVKGSPLKSEYVATVFHNPYNLSIVQISMPIVAPGLSYAVLPPPPPHISPVPGPAPMMAETSPDLVPSPMDAMTPASTPAPMEAAMTPGPGPGPVPGPAAETSPAKEPTEDNAPSSAPAPSDYNDEIMEADTVGSSSSARNTGLGFGVVLLLSLLGYKIA